MVPLPVAPILAVSCPKDSTSATVTGTVLVLAIVGAIVGLAIANGRSRQRLASARAEIAYLRPENARLQAWLTGLTGAAPGLAGGPGVGAGGTGAHSIPAQWYPEPSGRHELRYWDGVGWSDRVSDRGATSVDPAV